MHYIIKFYIYIIIHYMHEKYTIYAWNINLFWRKERKVQCEKVYLYEAISERNILHSPIDEIK